MFHRHIMLFKKGAGFSFIVTENSTLRFDINNRELEKRQIKISQESFDARKLDDLNSDPVVLAQLVNQRGEYAFFESVS